MICAIPYRIESLLQERPWANWMFIGMCTFMWLTTTFGWLPYEVVERFFLNDWEPIGLVGHIFIHADFFHLAGNMLFLWVFGNAVCGNIGNKLYLVVFPACGAIGGMVHLIIDGSTAIGASGAVNGIVGLTLAMYPTNRVGIFWWFFVRAGWVHFPAWVLILLWLVLDVLGVMRGEGAIAYWAHLGGLVTGLATGLLLLGFNWVKLTQWDNPSLLDLITGRHRRRA